MPRWDRLLYYHHPLYLQHLQGIEHPECPKRLKVITRHLTETKLFEKIVLKQAQPVEKKWVLTNHDEHHFAAVEQAVQAAPQVLDGGDTVVTEHSLQAALLAAGAAVAGVDDLIHGNAAAVFCAVRPPGHHAEFDRAMGFCLFNNVAIAARYAIDRHSLQRVFILDWDVHHGNGTQNSFYDMAEVYFCSIHQAPLYPGTGHANERGRGLGLGYNLNIPLPAGCDDQVYFTVLQDKIIPELIRYRPDLLIISAGFDAHTDDPLAGMQVSTEGFGKMTTMLRDAMKTINNDKILSVLEGGYHQINLAESVEAHLYALAEE